MKKQNVRTLSFIVSTFTYLLAGAAIFDALESQTEDQLNQKINQSLARYQTDYKISESEFRDLELRVSKFHLYKTYPQWEFPGAFYFSLTVITTIGYGHSTPQTILGKIFCMLYATVGIPLCLVMFQAVGERLNYFTSFCIQFFKKAIRLKNIDVNQTELVFVGGILAVLVITGGAALFTHYEGWSYFNSMYYCVVTLTTIGFGDFVALQGEKGTPSNMANTGYLILSLTFILFGLTVVASSINLLVLKFLTMNTDDERREEFTREAQRNQSLRFSSADLLNVVNGNVICTFEPADLEDLRRENSLLCCNSKNSFLSRFRNRFLTKSRTMSTDIRDNDEDVVTNQITYINNNDTNFNIQNDFSREEDPSCYSCLGFGSNNNNNRNYTSQVVTNADGINSPVVYKGMKKKRKHYTIRRSPGMISHLLPLQRLDSIMTHAKLKEHNINLKSKVESKFTKPISIMDQSNNNSPSHDQSSNRDSNNISENKNHNLDVTDFIDQDNSITDFDTNNQAQTTNTLLNNTLTKNNDDKNDKTSLQNKKPIFTNDDESSLNDADADVVNNENDKNMMEQNFIFI